MSNLSNTMGEGGGGGRRSGAFTDTGYGTHDGQGNVPSGAPYEKGTGYDEHGQVATSFGKWAVGYDPVTGMAVEHVTSGYDMGGADVGGGVGGELPGAAPGGLVDVSAPASGHSVLAPAELQRAVQDFFQSQEQAPSGANAPHEQQGSSAAEARQAQAEQGR